MEVPMNYLLVLCTLLLLTPAAWSQNATWVRFRDKGPTAPRALLSSSSALSHIDEAARERRERALGPDQAFDESDLPVHSAYIDAVLATGATVRARSRWVNSISVLATPAQCARIRALPFVAELRPVLRFRQVFPESSHPVGDRPSLARPTLPYSELAYGASEAQLSLIEVPRVHDVWFDGTGITVGMLDNGFRWRTHESLKSTHVLAELDVINQDSVTENEAGDLYAQDDHGTATFSTLAGFAPGVLIGPAFGARFLLGKTEVMGSETRIEEDYWVQGLEWLESRGASVVSSSLGYLDFDDGFAYSQVAGDLDGNTAPCSRAAARAARLGVVVVISNGNDGPAPGTLGSPADADSIISVGAVTSTNQIAVFSSSGPSSDGRIKPDVCATGVGVYCATKAGDALYTYSSGTSLSCPLAAGVAAIVRSARPELSPLQVRDALRATADHASSPDNRVGWGTISAWKALLHHGLVISTHPRVFWLNNHNVIAAYVLSPHQIDPAKTLVRYTVNGGQETVAPMSLYREIPELGSGSGLYTLELPTLPESALVRYALAATDTRETRSQPWRAPLETYAFRVGEQVLVGGEDIFPKSFALGAPYPSPFQPERHDRVLIPFSLETPASVTLDVYDRLGRLVTRLHPGTKSQGTHLVAWTPGTLASGVYTVRLTAGDRSAERPVLIVR